METYWWGASENSLGNKLERDTIPAVHLAIWNIESNEVSSAIKVQSSFGNLFAINDRYCWDVYQYPKVIDIATGEVVALAQDISTGEQDSSIIMGSIRCH